jgi:ABC toxin N-terminal region/Neuraminidase-like domain/Salmonella virulence plasmid 28.1kDa A protein
MAATNIDICIRITVNDPQGKPLGGTVNLEFQPRVAPSPVIVKAADASKEIDVSGLERGPQGIYQMTVTPTDIAKPVTQMVSIPATGAATATVVIDKTPVKQPVTKTLKGVLVFDHGLPAANIPVRLYDVGFAGQDTQLGTGQTDAQGNYSFSYQPPAPVVSSAALPASLGVNLQMRVLDPAGKEISISATKYNAGAAETLNLVVPARVQPLAPEFQRLSADMQRSIGGIANLGQAQEGSGRQDLTLLNQSTNWDARVVALAASAAQNASTTGLGQDVLYALYRVGLPINPSILTTVPSATVQKALTKATQAGIVSLNSDQIATATSAFQNFASKTLLASTALGGVSSFTNLLATQIKDQTQQTAFANLYFNDPSARSALWSQAAKINIPAATIDSLRLQGKFLYLTFNNQALSQKLQQDIGSAANLPQLADKDYHQPATWQNVLTALAGPAGGTALDALIPPIYTGATTADRLAAYAGDMARKVRISFPTRTVARMVETKDIPIDPKTSANVTNFLRAASTAGYNLGRTPLNGFLAKAPAGVPALDDATKQSVKTLHRLFQVTPSTESLQAAVKLGFTSANNIASYSRTEFINQYAYAFPPGEAQLVYAQAQTVSSVTFNFFSMAKALDTSAPVYGLSSSASDRQNAKNALVQQFPSMASLFGNLDFCQCEDCRSVLSPAAYFVDLLDLLGKESAPNAAGNLPLDVLIGKNGGIKGRRPDLGALPLTCSNTNTAMPYIDLVNEILEYYIAHGNSLDAGAAYDTGTATTADLTAEPQHIIPSVYTNTLKQAVYPLDLPFDLWIETVRGFLNYFKSSLAQALDTLRPADTLELYTKVPSTPYYRAQILSEALGISPAEYAVFTATDTSKWFSLYGSYANEAAALNDLKNAKTLSQKLGVSYQGLTNLMETGFFNPGLYPLIFQFERFGIEMETAFAFTNQPGSTPLSAQDTADFQALLNKITAQYKPTNPAFDATAWLKQVLPANYSKTVLVLADPNSGCDFSGTTVQYADGSAAKPLDFLKLNLFVRLCDKLGCDLTDGTNPPAAPANPWTLDEIDNALQSFFPVKNLPVWGDATFTQKFGDSWRTTLVYLAHLDDLNTRLAPALGRVALLPFFEDLPTEGDNPLYSQIFLAPSVLANDAAFDDPAGGFPTAGPDLTPHATVIQGALGLGPSDITAILADANAAMPAAFSLDNLSLCYRYSQLAQCLQLSVSDLISLKTMSGLNPLQALTGNPLAILADDILLNQTLAFVKQVAVVQNSGFTVEDLKYVLRHQYDPAGKYKTDPNAQIALIQTIAGGIAQIQSQNTVPADPASMPESLIDQTLSGLFPAAILKTLFAQLTNAQTYTVSTNSAGPALALSDPTQAPELTLSFDGVTNTQTLTCKGLLPDWRKTELLALNTNAALNAVFTTLLGNVQAAARTALEGSIGDVLGVWASLVQYEAVATGVAQPQSISDPLGQLAQADPSLSFTYDASDQIQWLGYRGVLTTAKMNVLTGINASATLAALLSQVQQQALSAYNEMAASLAAMWINLQTYKVTQTAVAPGSQVDPTTFAAALAQAQQAGTITGPVPAVQLTYDSSKQIQTLVCEGVLTDSMRAQLAALITAPPAVVTLLGNLLQAVRTQAVNEFQFLMTNLLAPALNNPDPFVTPFLGAANLQEQKFAKAQLVAVFLPLLVQKLSRQLVLQTLSSTLDSDPSMTEALVTDAALLNDPNNPGKSLLQTFLGVGQSGVSAHYYDKSTALLASGIAATADTADPTNSVAGAVSCHFEGFLQASTDGPYRFFAELGNAGVQAVFRLDSPDPTALFPNPVIQATAAKDGDEASQFVQLKGGVAYHFTLDFLNLGKAGAKMLVQGETLPKGPLNQIVLYPEQNVDAFNRAQVLLGKVLQVLGVTLLDQRELTYMVANAAQFNNLRLSSLPTQANDDSVPKAVALFSQFLTLADYADLRKRPAGGTDGLINVFQAAATPAGLLASYYTSTDETGTPQASGIAATTDTADPSNSKPGTASCHFEGYLLAPSDGSYTFSADLGNKNAQVTFRLDAPTGTAPLANPIVIKKTAAADNEEDSQAVTLSGGVPYHLTLDFQSLGAAGAKLVVQGGGLAKGPLSGMLLYPISQLAPWTVLANLTRRTGQVVKDVATALGPDPHFSNNVGIRRMWDALQLVQILGLPVQAVSASTAIATPAPASPDVIAANFKNAVKAQYTPDQWRPIAQSVFDPLRQAKRDALVSYLINTLSLENSEQLFEYFLVDPGMEPVVQTSRLRLALSSVQTFIQRCFLSLEDGNSDATLDVAPSAIPADWWPWMKRYRVWQANREIFLFPENWMEPEFRLDQTDLFQALIGALLQGDVTSDLVEGAFSDYLKGLDLRARLDIVASYLDQNLTNPGESTLYVLGRTYGTPHKYFYRTYSSASWVGWQTVPVDIESDHIVLLIWRGRLNMFWLSFVTGAQAPNVSSSDTSQLGGLPFDNLMSNISGSSAQKQIQVQLHCSEYVQGKWTNPISSDLKKFAPLNVLDDFDANRDIYIHVDKEVDANGNEGAARILLDMNGYDDFFGFRVTTKNCSPDFDAQYAEFAPEMVYNAPGVDATRFTGSGTLTAGFANQFIGGNETFETENILNTVNNYELLTCGNPVVPAFLPTNDPNYQEAGSLVGPFFFKDDSNLNFASQAAFQDERTFFVQPSLTETVLEEWDGWAVAPSPPPFVVVNPNLIDHINVVAQVPAAGPVPIPSGDPVYSIYQVQTRSDWVTTPGVLVSFGGASIGRTGGIAAAGAKAISTRVGLNPLGVKGLTTGLLKP